MGLPVGLEIDYGDHVEPETVLASREIVQSGTPGRQFLVQSKGSSKEDSMWEDKCIWAANSLLSGLRTKLLFQREEVIEYLTPGLILNLKETA